MIPQMKDDGFGNFITEPITLDMLKQGIDRDFTDYNELHAILVKHGYKDYGWLNAGKVELPTCTFTRVYQNYSGSSCLYANHEFMVMYSVDMGD